MAACDQGILGWKVWFGVGCRDGSENPGSELPAGCGLTQGIYSLGLHFCMLSAYNLFFPIHPHQEDDAVENVFEYVHVQEMKPGGMVFDTGHDHSDPENVEEVHNGEVQGDVPELLYPGTV